MDEREAREIVTRTVQRLAAERERQGISMTKLAALAGIDTKTVSLIEKGERSPTLYTVIRIAGALGINPEELVAGGIDE